MSPFGKQRPFLWPPNSIWSYSKKNRKSHFQAKCDKFLDRHTNSCHWEPTVFSSHNETRDCRICKDNCSKKISSHARCKWGDLGWAESHVGRSTYAQPRCPTCLLRILTRVAAMRQKASSGPSGFTRRGLNLRSRTQSALRVAGYASGPSSAHVAANSDALCKYSYASVQMESENKSLLCKSKRHLTICNSFSDSFPILEWCGWVIVGRTSFTLKVYNTVKSLKKLVRGPISIV